MSGESEILEGFLCPMCKVDLSSITQLQAHFEEKHTEDKDALQVFKGFISKAKKKLLNEDETDSPKLRALQRSHADFEPNSPWDWGLLAEGPSRNLSPLFKKIRSARIDSYVAETNKLLIRLDKLLRDLPTEPVKRKAHEREVVMWADDKDVPLCPFCARSFNIARRRHHCRLCGGIMCDECSEFLAFEFAKKLIHPISQGGKKQGGATGVQNSSNSLGVTGLLGGVRGRSGSQGSLNSLLSVMDSVTGEQHFRTCQHCLKLLNARDRQVEQRTTKPILTLYYDKLMEYRQELERLLPQYNKMAESLNVGETTYNLRDAEELRYKVIKTGDGLSSMSQRIRTLGAGEEESSEPIGPRQEQLQRRIHSSTASFLKDNILGLAKLPTQDQLSKLQERRRQEAEARLASEREAHRQAEERAEEILRKREKDVKDSPRNQGNSGGRSTPRSAEGAQRTLRKKQTEEIMVDTGWGADQSAHNVTETDDPMIQQMNIIRNYIRQAREASRYDEVALLENNLKELQQEYKKQQRLMNP